MSTEQKTLEFGGRIVVNPEKTGQPTYQIRPLYAPAYPCLKIPSEESFGSTSFRHFAGQISASGTTCGVCFRFRAAWKRSSSVFAA